MQSEREPIRSPGSQRTWAIAVALALGVLCIAWLLLRPSNSESMVRPSGGGLEESPSVHDPNGSRGAELDAAYRTRGTVAVGGGDFQGLTLRVLDDHGAGLPEAEVATAPSTTPSPTFSVLGRTSTAGELRLAQGLDRSTILFVRRSGFQSRELLVEGTRAGSVVEITLARASALHGRIVRRGVEPRVGLRGRVLAWPKELRFAPRDYAVRSSRRDPRVLETTSDEEGWFVLDGLPTATTMAVVAGAPGWGMASSSFVDPSSTAEMTLELDRLFGVELRLVPEAGASPIDPRLQPPGNLDVVLGALQGRLILQPNFALELAGVGDAIPFGLPDRAAWLFVDPSSPAHLGPIAYHIERAGYEPTSGTIDALPLDDKLSVVEVPLHALSKAVGAMEWTLIDPLQSIRCKVHHAGPIAQIRLIGDDGTTRKVSIDDLSHGIAPMTGLPRGSYEVTFQALGSGFHDYDATGPAKRVAVGEGRANCPIDLSGSGAVEFELVQADGQTYYGPVAMMVHEGAPGEEGVGGWQIFESGPHRVDVLAPGIHSAYVFHPSMKIEDECAFEIQPGVLSRLTIRLRD